MPTLGHDITKFNACVKLLLKQLNARGQTTTDLLNHLLKGCEACSDKNFVKYIEDKETDYEEGKPLSADILMLNANNRFKARKLKGEWCAPDANKEKIIAMKAELDLMKKKFKGQGKGKREDKVPKGKKKDKGKFKKSQKPAWMFKPPPNHELTKPRIHLGHPWYFCHPDTGGKCDGVYRRHKPADCEGRAHSFKGKGRQVSFADQKSPTIKPEDDTTPPVPKKKPFVRLQKALNAVVEDMETDEDAWF